MQPNELIIRFDTCDRQSEGPVTRLVGFVRARNLLPLLDAADLEANPRQAKAGPITDEIQESIRTAPELFPFKTKGLLIASADCRQLERSRFHLSFENAAIEGVLDGGHNTLAIGLHILSLATDDARAVKRAKDWPSFKALWTASAAKVKALKDSTKVGDGGPLDFLVPVEVLIPTTPEDPDAMDAFTRSLFEIGAARNNNKQLADEAKANKKGLYDYLRSRTPAELAKRVEWKTNDGGDVKVRDLIALAWIPLSLAKLPAGVPMPAPRDSYSGKGKCSSAFDALMEHPKVSTPTPDGTFELHDPRIGSALAIAGQLPKLADQIYEAFPAAYNDNGAGRFGRLSSVKMADDMKSKPLTPFYKKPVKYSYPDGFIMPLVVGLRALLMLDAKGHVQWRVPDPAAFVRDNLLPVVRSYRGIIDAFGDPQKIGKNDASYNIAHNAFETELLKTGRQAA